MNSVSYYRGNHLMIITSGVVGEVMGDGTFVLKHYHWYIAIMSTHVHKVTGGITI